MTLSTISTVYVEVLAADAFPSTQVVQTHLEIVARDPAPNMRVAGSVIEVIVAAQAAAQPMATHHPQALIILGT